MPTLPALLAIAEAATPGPRRDSRAGDHSSFAHVTTGADDGPGQTIAQWTLPADARHIAAFDRETCVALVKVAMAAKAWRDVNTGMHTNGPQHTLAMRDTRAELIAAVTALTALTGEKP